MPEAAASPWARAQTALALLAIDPDGLGGMVVRSRAGPVRDAFVRGMCLLAEPSARVPPAATDDRLFGGVDIAATLAAGRTVRREGILDGAATLVLPMAERVDPRLAARLAQRMDTRPLCLLALDEGIEDEEVPAALAERMAFRIDLGTMVVDMGAEVETTPPDIAAARSALSRVTVAADDLLQITVCAMQLGIESLRATRFALNAARAHAALAGRRAMTEEDLLAAIDLTLAHRATRLPDMTPDAPDPEPERDESDRPDSDGSGAEPIPEDILLDAIRANLPPGLLDGLAARAARRGHGAGSGARRRSNRRGRPLPARPGRLDGSAQIDLVATLRAAAPWQTIRAAERPERAGIHVRSSDIRVKVFEQKSDRLLIFTVDASGSAALARLAEAKGAVELLLSEAYSRRDHVALVAFRGTDAEVLLPPTRSLVRTKRQLAALPGGGGTPLAAGLRGAFELAEAARGRGLTPTLVLLTDGRANIALDGTADRDRAARDAVDVARSMRSRGFEAIVLDMGNRPEPGLKRLAGELGGIYLPLPRADAQRLSGAVAAALRD